MSLSIIVCKEKRKLTKRDSNSVSHKGSNFTRKMSKITTEPSHPKMKTLPHLANGFLTHKNQPNQHYEPSFYITLILPYSCSLTSLETEINFNRLSFNYP